jgi:hypothetical protein
LAATDTRPGYDAGMSAAPAEPPPSPLDPVQILRALPESDRDDFLAAYREAHARAADPAGFAALLRLLRLWSMHAVAAAQPGYADAREAAMGPVSGGMFLEDLLRQRG